MNKDVQQAMAWVLKDLQVEMKEQFLTNFERQAFFSEAWQRRKSPLRGDGAILIDTGDLRRSIGSRVTANSVVFYTTLPYAAIHNEGGEIVVTQRMKMFFRHKYYDAVGGFGRERTGDRRRTLTDAGFYALMKKHGGSDEALFWGYMALKKVGSTIKIPQRKFLGSSPEVEQIVRRTIEESLTEYFENEFEIDVNVK